MLNNTAYFKGKVVLDVGCGTGILSMVAARAGAKKVVGVDESSILDYTRKIVAKNGFSDVITLVQGRIEETPLPLEEDEVPAALSHTLTRTLLFDLYISVFDPH
jgi:ribosomal protein L11 methylase PrmA